MTTAACPINHLDCNLKCSVMSADYHHDAGRNRIVAVCEDHSGAGEAVNTIAAINLTAGSVSTLVSGCDFYSSPVLDAAGQRMAWVQWCVIFIRYHVCLVALCNQIDAIGRVSGRFVCTDAWFSDHCNNWHHPCLQLDTELTEVAPRTCRGIAARFGLRTSTQAACTSWYHG